MFSLYRWFVRYHSQLDVIQDKIFKTIGFSFFFWKPLLLVKTDVKVYYFRSSHAEEVKENLMKRWIND